MQHSGLSRRSDGRTGPLACAVAGLVLLASACQAPTEARLTQAQPTVTPSALTLSQGHSEVVTLTLPDAPQGTVVTWTVTGASPGIATRVSTGTSGAAGATLTVVVGSALQPGTYRLTVSGSAGGVVTQPAQLEVTVSQATGSGLVDIVTGAAFACGRTPANAVWCWGQNQAGQIGDGTTTHRLTPVAVNTPLPFIRLEAGEYNICGFTAFGTIYCWGIGDSGQLGNGVLANVRTATEMQFAPPFVDWRASLTNSCGLTAEQVLYCWGNNFRGGVGDGTQIDRILPTPVAGGLRFASVSVGRDHSCGITTDHRTYCWGENTDGQIGDGTTTNRFVPTPVASEETFTAVSAGFVTTCALTAAGKAYCWGRGTAGALGNGDESQRRIPTAVIGGLAFTELRTGAGHTCGLARSGQVWCWGSNGAGELGSGVAGNSKSGPTPVVVPTWFEQLRVGWGFTCGRAHTNQVYCWGYNAYGALGDGTQSSRLTPQLVPVP